MTAKAKIVTYVPPANPAMMGMSREALVLHGRKSEKQAIEAGLEILRRADNKLRRAQAA